MEHSGTEHVHNSHESHHAHMVVMEDVQLPATVRMEEGGPEPVAR